MKARPRVNESEPIERRCITGYNANRRDLILIAVCIVLLTLKYLFNI